VPFEPLPLTADTLTSLLSEGTERPGLDYKQRVDLSDTKETVVIAKHLGAMQIEGGYIVIGADNNGQPSQKVTESEAELFDQATVHSKVERYLAEDFDVRSTALELDGHRYGLICVLPHRDGFAPFKEDGAYTDQDGKQRTVFHKGEVFARHGSKSERWNQADVRKVTLIIRHQEREAAREEFRGDLQAIAREGGAAVTAAGPIAALTFRLDTDTLVDIVLEQLRRQDEIPLNLLLRRAPQEASKQISAGDHDALDGLLDRLVSVAGALLIIGRPDLVTQVIRALTTIYNLGFDARGMDRGMLPISSFDLGLRVVTRVQALGALAAREPSWRTIRELVLQRPAVHDADYWQNWILRGLVMAARAGLLNDPQQGPAGMSPLSIAQEHIFRLQYLHQDLGTQDEAVITSLCQFDLLDCLIASSADADRRRGAWLPNFARWSAERSDPAVVAVLEDPDARSAIFPGSDQELADALYAIGEEAHRFSFALGGWQGYTDPRIHKFLQQHPPHPPAAD
jgi:hypothetical protein